MIISLMILKKIKELVEIRKYASKQWFLLVEYPTGWEAITDDDGNVVIPKDVYSSLDISFDLLLDTLFKDLC